MMRLKLYTMTIVLLLIVNSTYAWKESGKESDPYLIESLADWQTLASTLYKEGSVSGYKCVKYINY